MEIYRNVYDTFPSEDFYLHPKSVENIKDLATFSVQRLVASERIEWKVEWNIHRLW